FGHLAPHRFSRGGRARRGGHDGTGRGGTAVKVAREGARLSGDQVAGGYVPRRKAGFVVAVQAATADPAQVEGRRPAPPDVSHRRQDMLQPARLLSAAAGVIGEAGSDEGRGQVV